MKDTTLNDKYESKFTLHNIGKSIARYKWWVIGASVVGLVAGYLVFSFVINPPREKLVSTFGYDINISEKLDESGKPIDNSGREYFADSTVFSFTDIVSKESMESVKASNPDKFGTLNIESLYQNGSISISKQSYTNSQTGQTIYVSPARYTIVASKRAFSSESQGKDFIYALIDRTRLLAQEANDKFQIENCVSASSNISYSQLVSQLSNQYEAILDTYSSLQKEFAYSTKVSETLTLGEAHNAFVDKFADKSGTIISTLQGELAKNKIVDYTVETIESLKATGDGYIENIRLLLNQLEAYQNSLNDLLSSQIIVESDSEVSKLIVELTEKVSSTQLQISNLGNELKFLGYDVPTAITKDNVDSIAYNPSLDGAIQAITTMDSNWVSKCDSFKQKIASLKTDIETERKAASKYYSFINNNAKNKVAMYTSGIAVTEGHVFSGVGAIVGVVLCFIVSTLVVSGVYISKLNKEEEK